jgi:cleavage stimulation factor subunit 3
MDWVRKVYHRALVTPLEGLETLWHAYDAYENSLNKLTAKKMLQDKSPAYMTARAAAKELRELLTIVDRDQWADAPTDDAMAVRITAPWMRWVAWEKANPLQVPDKSGLLQQRVQYAYKAATSCLRQYGEIWFGYAKWLISSNKTDEAETALREAVTILPDELLIIFALCDLLEMSDTEGKPAQAREVYEALLARLTSDQGPEDATRLTLAWIQFMNYSRRVEGIASARAVFTRARKDPNTTHQIFLAAARMELLCKKDAIVAGRILELGMARFSTNSEYILAYLQHLLQQGDEQNAAALFERVAPALGMEGVEVWKTYLDHIFRYADLSAVRLLVRRFQEMFPDQALSTEITVFCRQYSYDELGVGVDRIWIDPSSVSNSNAPIGTTIKPFHIPTPVQDLIDSLPLDYDGPIISIDGIVRLLQVVSLMGSAPPRVTPVNIAHVAKKPPQNRRGKRHRFDDGDDVEATRIVTPREDDIFAARYRSRNK